MKRTLIAVGLLGIAAGVVAADRPRWHEQTVPTAAQLRDVSVVDARVAWATGDDGVVLRTTDGGRKWRAVGIDDADGISFRDIEAFSSRSATVLATGAGTGSRIYRTEDAGKTWQLQYQGRESRPALACMGFWNEAQGVALGESSDGRFQLRATRDGGRTWKRVAKASLPEARGSERVIGDGQNCLAATGNGRIAFAAGEASSARMIASGDSGTDWRHIELPHLAAIAPSSVGLLLKGGNAGFAARGVDDATVATQLAQLGAVDRTALRRDGRVQWVSVGKDGSALTDRRGDHTSTFSEASFAAVDGSANGALVLAVGSDGRIAQLRW